jgi:hypothetical protein
MKRALSIFALLMAASMLIWIAGCGEDDEEEAEPPVVQSTNPAEGGSIPANASISVTFDQTMESVEITIPGVTGTITGIPGKTATFKPAQPMAEGAHAATITGTSKDGADLEAVTVNFTATALDEEPPTLVGASCDPNDGEDGVDPADYPEAIEIALNDNVGVTEAKVIASEPEFDFLPEFSDGVLTLTFMQYSMPNEQTFEITVEAKDAAGNVAELDYSFTTMAKEEG